MTDDPEKQLRWFELLNTDPKQAVNKLIRNEINSDPMDCKDDPAFNLRYLNHKAEAGKHGEILPLVDVGLCLWFKEIKDSRKPPRWYEWKYVVHIWRALSLVDRFNLPQTIRLLSCDEWGAWFDTLPVDYYAISHKQKYQTIMLSKGNIK